MITDLDVIVKEWAYRTDSGKPNPKNDNPLAGQQNEYYY